MIDNTKCIQSDDLDFVQPKLNRTLDSQVFDENKADFS
jgi:hypothetical protein